jgi:hypothetical protein
VPAGPFLEFVEETAASEKGNDDFSEIVRENLWHIYLVFIRQQFRFVDIQIVSGFMAMLFQPPKHLFLFFKLPSFFNRV